MRKLIFILFFVSLFVSHKVTAQEVKVPLQMNPIVAKKWQQVKQKASMSKTATVIIDTLSLPFLDDFSKETVYPDSSMWIDKKVFINRTFPIAPPSIGVATFDGIDSTGYPYDFSASSTSSGPADFLTSKPIDLTAPNLLDDSVYFSFFYQAMGLGAAPGKKDSLALEFRDPVTNTWKWIWSHKGYTPASNDTNFHLVMIPIKDSAYYKVKGFQFRFRNYATLSGEVDQWNVDYVYLNKNRNISDTAFADVAFVYDAPSLLKNYQEMPWRQYKPSELRDSVKTMYNFIRNNDNKTNNAFYHYRIRDNSNTQVSLYSGGNDNIDPYIPNGYLNYPPISTPPLNYKIPLLTDSVEYTWEAYLNPTADINNNNDTIRRYQKFANYYAYDDGTAESGYGLKWAGSNPQGAIKFTLNVTDTLRAIQIYFIPLFVNKTAIPFHLAVWGDNSGIPGSISYYEDSVSFPVYDTGYNSFHTYKLKKLAIYNPGTYYVGWVQTTSDLLNIGMDLNTNSQPDIFFNTTGFWQLSSFKCSIMLRPVFGKDFPVTGIPEQQAAAFNFDVFPNPTQDKFNINFSEREKLGAIQLNVIDTYGRIVYAESNFTSPTIDVSQFSQGIYFVKIIDQNANSSIKRVAVVR